MSIEIKVPTLPESVADALIVTWEKKAGDSVKRDEVLVVVETDKVALDVPSPSDGVLEKIVEEEGTTVSEHQVIGILGEGSGEGGADDSDDDDSGKDDSDEDGTDEDGSKAEAGKKTGDDAGDDDAKQSGSKASTDDDAEESEPSSGSTGGDPQTSPSVRKLLDSHGLKASEVPATGKNGRLLRKDVEQYIKKQGESDDTTRSGEKAAGGKADEQESAKETPVATSGGVAVGMAAEGGERLERRVPMTRLRKRIADRLLTATQTTAMLTTFNEVDMSGFIDMRSAYKDQFEKTHGVKLGFMSIFLKAATEALKRYPDINASIDGDDIVYHGYCDIGVAVSSDRGLVVPVLRNTEHMSLADLEKTIGEFAEKARKGKLTVEDMTGGTFTVSNGGVFGSLMSTPILNPPQSAILGMHATQQRPVAVNGEVVIRPMMYVALSYDHRVVDGKGAVGFLKTIKEMVEEPGRIVLGV